MNTSGYQAIVSKLAGPRIDRARPPRMSKKLASFIKSDEGKVTFPDERAVLDAVCQLIDDEKHADAAWELVNDINGACDRVKPPDSHEIHLAVCHNVSPFTVAYYDAEDTENGASGVLIEIGGRSFLATCAHSVRRRPQGRLVMVGYLEKGLCENKPQILSYGRGDDCDYPKDVAYVEISNSFVETYLQKDRLPLSRVNPCGFGRANHNTVLCGYPRELITTTPPSAGRVGQIQFQVQSWNFPSVLMPENWSMLPECKPAPDPLVDMFMAYDINSEVARDGKWTGERLPEPFGLSGGGFWQKNSALPEIVWTADSYQLVAIQSGWPDDGRYLRATQIVHWLRLIWQDHPELQPILASTFPSVDW